jgi:hypothetical protein
MFPGKSHWPVVFSRVAFGRNGSQYPEQIAIYHRIFAPTPESSLNRHWRARGKMFSSWRIAAMPRDV